MSHSDPGKAGRVNTRVLLSGPALISASLENLSVMSRL